MKFTKTSLIFFISLVAIAAFLSGFKYSLYVNDINMEIAKITPVVSPTPDAGDSTAVSPTPKTTSQEFRRYINTECGISFILPIEYEKQKTASDAGLLRNEGNMVKITCNKAEVADVILALSDKTPVQTQKIQQQNVRVYATSGEKLNWVITNSKNGKKIYIVSSKNLQELIASTLEFSADSTSLR